MSARTPELLPRQVPGVATTTALELPDDLSRAQWQQVGETLGKVERAVQWWVGDWLNFGERHYGDGTYEEAADLTGLKYQTLRHLASVAARVCARAGTLSWTHHREVAALSPDEQERWLKRAEDEGLTHRELRALIAARPAIAPPTGTYSVLLADPPWQFDTQTSLPTRAVTRHYPTMSTEEICALALPAAADAVLFCWATPSLISEALDVIDAWGFEYRSQLVWVKDKLGLGYWVRNRHELLLIAARGKFSPPSEGVRPDSVITAPRGRHSEKPVGVYELIERAYPDTPRVELFARTRRQGWDAWGHEVAE